MTDPSPLQAAWAAITRETFSGAIAGADFRIDRWTALAGVTNTPAALLGRKDAGVIAPGATADLVLLDDNPVTTNLGALARIGVTETWVGGKLAWAADPRAAA